LLVLFFGARAAAGAGGGPLLFQAPQNLVHGLSPMLKRAG
jgi:hypothetical protein